MRSDRICSSATASWRARLLSFTKPFKKASQVAAPRPVLPANQNMSTSILLQGFHWESAETRAWYDIVQDKVADIKAAGVTHIWLPPPSQAIGGTHGVPEGYQPQQLYDLNTPYGEPDELKTLIKDLKAAGIKPIADIVINHRSAECRSANGQYIKFKDTVAHPGRRIDWGPSAVCRNCPFHGDGNDDTGDFAYFAPDLDHTNQCVQEGLKDWLNWLKNDIGFEGFRFDMVKGYAPHFTKLYLEATGMANNSSLCVGEHYTANLVNNEAVYDQNPSRQAIVNWIDGTGGVCMAFDFPTKFILNATVKGFQPTLWRLIDPQGKPPGLMGWWPGKAVTFVENHDTEPVRNNGQDFPSSGLQLGYAYILTHPGTPCVFWRHMFDGDEGLKSAIRALMRTRTRNGITSESPITILEHDADLYMARIGNKLTVKLGPRYELGSRLPKESDGWHLACSGQNWAVWEKR